MNILSVLHAYPPHDNSGAEHTLHAIHKWLIDRGHRVTVYCHKHQDYTLDTVRITNQIPDIRGYNLIFTHLNNAGTAVNWARQYKKPLVYFTHNDTVDNVISVRKNGLYIVHNSKWVIDNLGYHQHPNIIVNPPTFRQDYILKGKKNQEYVTLVNCNKNKGGYILVDIAKAMPNTKFLAVMGAYGAQVTKYPNNVKVLSTQNDIRKVLRMTKILLMPSQYESWGKVGVEAMVNGIPVIAHPAEGLKESLSHAGIFCDRKDIQAWVKAINDLQVEQAYNERSKMCKLRVKELDPEPQMIQLEQFLQEILIDKWKHNI